MAARDLFGKPFDDGTLDKLEIFESYFKEWLPVFISSPKPYRKEIQIFDLFAGKGKDSNGIHGSPMRILEVLNQNVELIKKSKVQIKIVINELKKNNYVQLIENLESIAQHSLYKLTYHNKDFVDVFNQYYDSMRRSANFLFLDQNGIKAITKDVFSRLISLKQTDFLFFISSSYVKRFVELEEFRKYLDITKQELEGKSYYHIHRIVIGFYRSLVPNDKEYYLAPFSIKKPTGVYGLIFGSNHTYGMEKFLNVCWKRDKLTGEANFDIDNERIDLFKPALFAEYNTPSKRQLFEINLKTKVFDRELRTNRDVYLYGLTEGFLPADVNTVLKNLRDERKIEFNFKLIKSRIHSEITSPIKLI